MEPVARTAVAATPDLFDAQLTQVAERMRKDIADRGVQVATTALGVAAAVSDERPEPQSAALRLFDAYRERGSTA